MSKIHQAIRRAEREGKRNPPESERRRPASTDPVGTERGGGSKSMAAVVEAALDAERWPSAAGPVLPEKRQSVAFHPDPRVVAISAPRCYASEQYRALKARLYQLREKRLLKTILVTSAAPGEGKTLSSVNLALTIAQEIEETVLMVDADLRKPNVHKTLGVPTTQGLADLLNSGSRLDSVLHSTTMTNLFLVQAGTVPENPAELLNSQSMRDFLSAASERFDWVILDSPPYLPLADAELMSTMVDGILFVVRASHTPASLVSKSAESLRGKNLLGVIFNGNQGHQQSQYFYNYSYSDTSV
ncbi:MAG: CpsD/CapB family tyrosine-protein kinase [Acidobacteriota bacterium]